jgi:hypothetical protein
MTSTTLDEGTHTHEPFVVAQSRGSIAAILARAPRPNKGVVQSRTREPSGLL